MILALDSSTARGSVALVEEGRVVREIFVETPRGRGGAMFRAVEEILRDRPVLERVVAGTGPGSYNGIRTALACGWGIAQAGGVALVGVCSLLGLDEGTYYAVGDARRGQYYFAEVQEGVLVEEPILLDSQAVSGRVAGRRVIVPAPVQSLPDAVIATPSAARLGRIGEGMAVPAGVPEPLYLKEPFITEPRVRT